MCAIVSDAERATRFSTPRSRMGRKLIHLAGGTMLTTAAAVVSTIGLSAPRPAGADQMSDLQTQASQLEQSINNTNQQLDASSQQYDAAQYHLSQLNGQITTTKHQISSDQSKVQQDTVILRKASVNAYVTDGSAASENPLFANNQRVLGNMQVYNSVAEGDLSTAVADLHTAQSQLDSQKSQLQSQQDQAQQQVDAAQQAKQQASQLEGQQQSELNQDKGQIATLVAQQQAAQAAAEEAATRAKLAAAQAAQQQQQQQQTTTQEQPQQQQTTTSQQPQATTQQSQQSTTPKAQDPTPAQILAQGPEGNGPAGPTSSTVPATTVTEQGSSGSGGGGFSAPPGASGASVAVAAAESQIGVPYVYADATPGQGFDCSGLTMWAWGQAGVSLPHYSGAQMAATTPVPVSDLQPGDLLFYGPGGSEHVAMYIGGGSQIEATIPGSTVMINPLRLGDGFVGAGRP